MTTARDEGKTAIQTKLAEVRVRVPYFTLKKWKDYPLPYQEAIEKLESVRDELEDALEKIEEQLGAMQ